MRNTMQREAQKQSRARRMAALLLSVICTLFPVHGLPYEVTTHEILTQKAADHVRTDVDRVLMQQLGITNGLGFSCHTVQSDCEFD